MKRILVNPRDPKIKIDGEYKPIDARFEETGESVLYKTNINVDKYSTEFAVQLGFGDILHGRTDSEHSFFMFEYTATSPQLQLDSHGHNIAFGYGMRVGIVVKDSSISGSVNLSQLAAQAEIKSAETICSADFYSIDTSIFQTLNLLLPSEQPFDASYITNIGSAVALIAETMIKNPGTEKLLPQYVVEIPTSEQLTYITGLSASYALHGMTHSKSFDSEVSRLNDKLGSGNKDYFYDRVELLASTSIYDNIMDSNYSSTPSSSQVTQAKSIYNLWPE